MKNVFKSITKKQTLFFVILAVTALNVISCKDVKDYKEGYFLAFYPQKCEMVTILSYKSVSYYHNGVLIYGDRPLDSSNNEVKWDSVYFTVTSLNSSRGKFLDDSIPSLEHEIKVDYERLRSLNASKSSVSISDEPKTYSVSMDYSTSGLKNINITAIDAPLFGTDKSKSLNDYVKISKYEPNFIASFDTKSLIYGFGDDDKPQTIAGLLALNPLVPFQMIFEFKVKPDNLPVSTRFKIELENSDGKLIADTTEMLDILK